MNTLKAMTLFGITIALAAMLGHEPVHAGIDAGGKPKYSKGRVTTFGSIYVNGVRYNTDNALFIINGAIGTESDLTVGQVVTVLGAEDVNGTTGTADVVISNNAVAGPVSGIDASAGRLVVLGQPVIVDAGSSFSVGEGVESIADLNSGDVVAVSGHVNAYGEIVATHISGADNGSYDVTGDVAFVDDSTYLIGINGLLVDYSAANLHGFDKGSPEVGQTVSVTGQGIDAGGVMVASSVAPTTRSVSGSAGESADVEGLVTNYGAPWNFAVDGTPVKLKWGTKFEGGWLFDLGLDRKLEVEGEFDANGRLVADRIIFEGDATGRVSGYVSAVDGDTVVVDGLAVQMRDTTEYEDDSDYGVRRFTAEDLHAGDYVDMAVYSSAGKVIATRLERDED